MLPVLSFIFTSVRSRSSSLIVADCSPRCEFGLGSLSPSPLSLWDYREALFGAERSALVLKRFKTKPKETRPTACQNVSGIFKPPLTSAAKPQSFSCLACVVPLAGVTWPSEHCRCSTGFTGTNEQLSMRHNWASGSVSGAHNCGGSFQCSLSSLSCWPRAVPGGQDRGRLLPTQSPRRRRLSPPQGGALGLDR